MSEVPVVDGRGGHGCKVEARDFAGLRKGGYAGMLKMSLRWCVNGCVCSRCAC